MLNWLRRSAAAGELGHFASLDETPSHAIPYIGTLAAKSVIGIVRKRAKQRRYGVLYSNL